MYYLVGLDIGGTKTEALVVDQTASVRGRVVHPTVTSSPVEMVRGIAQTVQAALAEGGIEPGSVAGVGAGVPGQVIPETGRVQLAVNLGLRDYPLGPALSEALGAPVMLENDVRLAALGAYELLTRQEHLTSLAYIGVGTGIAAGVVLNGKLYRGAHGMAGEVGHIVVQEGGEQCICGQYGCLETIAAGPAIARRISQSGLAGQAHTLSDLLARHGDPEADALVERVAHALARAVQWMVMAYDVERVVLGGGVVSAGAAALRAIHIELAAFRAESPLVQMMVPDERVTLLPANFNAGTYGAIRLAKSLTDPELHS